MLVPLARTRMLESITAWAHASHALDVPREMSTTASDASPNVSEMAAFGGEGIRPSHAARRGLPHDPCRPHLDLGDVAKRSESKLVRPNPLNYIAGESSSDSLDESFPNRIDTRTRYSSSLVPSNGITWASTTKRLGRFWVWSLCTPSARNGTSS
jgi:hypothetical protein